MIPSLELGRGNLEEAKHAHIPTSRYMFVLLCCVLDAFNMSPAKGIKIHMQILNPPKISNSLITELASVLWNYFDLGSYKSSEEGNY